MNEVEMPGSSIAPQVPSLETVIEGAVSWLEEHQSVDGFWVGMLESNACIEAEWLLAMHFLGLDEHPLKEGIVKALLKQQRSDGSWEIYFEAPVGDINATVESYAALRSVGMSPDDPPLQKARQWILSHGGFRHIRVFTRYWLALIGEWPWEETPNVPPEVIFFPKWFPFNIYNFASWARATLLPLTVLSAKRAAKPLPPDRRMDELFPHGRDSIDYSLPKKKTGLSLENIFRMADKWLHIYQGLGFTPGRRTAVKAVTNWIVAHQDDDGAWGGIQPPWIYSIMALYAQGRELNDPVIKKGLAALEEHWSYVKDDAVHIQASESPIWDTLLAVLAMLDAGVKHSESEAMQRAVEWILQQQITVPGDWTVKVKAPCGGWAFERSNQKYPDIDDTSVALMVLAKVRDDYPDQARIEIAIERAVQWTLAMQSKNGGWAAFDKDNDKAILTKIPFCDFGEALDPPSVDVTCHVLEALGELGYSQDHPSVAKALSYVLSEQESEGSWFGRWGVNHIYGTAAVLPALKALNIDMSQSYVLRAVQWIVDHQNDNGGWGETPASYMDDALRGVGPSTPSQTAWALMCLAVAEPNEVVKRAIRRGVDYLSTRQMDGTWEERHYTGTGFPGYGIGSRKDLKKGDLEKELQQGKELSRGFMINYNMYRHYFPLMALGRLRGIFEY